MTISKTETQRIEIVNDDRCDAKLVGALLGAASGDRVEIWHGTASGCRRYAPDRCRVLPSGRIEMRFGNDPQPIMVYPEMVSRIVITNPSYDLIESIRRVTVDSLARAKQLECFASELLAALQEDSGTEAATLAA